MSDRPLGVLLTGGLGTRLQPLTPALSKAMVPLLNRPLVAYGLELLASMGIDELVVVTGGGDSRTGPVALAAAPPGTTVTLAEQPQPLGPGDALASVGTQLDGRTVVVLAVDTVLRGGDLASQLEAFMQSDAVAWLPLHTTDRPQQMGIALLEGDRITALEEKPQQPRSNLACVGLWLLAPEAVERVRTNPVITPKGEHDLTGTIAALLNEGWPVGGRVFEGAWMDGGALGGLLAAQLELLTDLVAVPFESTDSTIEGVAAAGSGTQVLRSQLRGPVLLGNGVRIENCVLGPGVVVADGADLRDVHLERALVAPGATLRGIEQHDVVITTTGEIVSVA